MDGEPHIALQQQEPEDLGFASSNTRFQCTKCGQCCRLEVELTSEDVSRIRKSGRVGVYVDNVLRNRCTLASFYGGAACFFLEHNMCSIYEHRPLLCRIYPFFPIPVKSLDSSGLTVPSKALKVSDGSVEHYFTIDPQCPGLGKGLVPRWEEILSMWMQHMREGSGRE